MDLRIRLGNCNKLETQLSNNKLKVIYDKNNCIVESDKELVQYNFGTNKKLFFFGKIIGVKLNNTKLIGASSKLNQQITKSFSTSDLEKAIKTIEGRFIYIYIDGNHIHLGTDSLGQIDLYYQKDKDGVILSSHLGLLPFVKDNKIEYDQVGAAHALYIYGYRPAKKHNTICKSKKIRGTGENRLERWKV